MNEAPTKPIRSPKVVLDDVINFSVLGGKCRFVPGGSKDQYIDLDSWLINAVFDANGNVLYGGISIPVISEECRGLQIAFSNNVDYVGPSQDALLFNLTGGRVYDKNGSSNTLSLRYPYVKAVFDRSGTLLWKNVNLG